MSTNVSLDELQNIPSSRDPWVVLQTVPGIIVDRVNVGGAESGQQSSYQAKGASRRRQHVEHGRHRHHGHGGARVVADLLRLRHVPGNAGHDGRRRSVEPDAGRAAELRAAQRHQPLARVGAATTSRTTTCSRTTCLQTHRRAAAELQPRQSTTRTTAWRAADRSSRTSCWSGARTARRIPQMEIYTYNAAERPSACQDRAGLHRVRHLHMRRPNRTYQITARDCTTLENYRRQGDRSALAQRCARSFTYFRGDKHEVRPRRQRTRPAPTTWNQKGPTDLFKGEVNYTMSNSTFLTGALRVHGRRLLARAGRRTRHRSRSWTTPASSRNYLFYETDRPQNNLQLEGNSLQRQARAQVRIRLAQVFGRVAERLPGGRLNDPHGLPGHVHHRSCVTGPLRATACTGARSSAIRSASAG